MSAPPTTRATRSRYSSPAVGGTGAGPRGSSDSSRAKDKESRDAASLDRSRQFMEAWIEPERARLASFQEDGLVRQGVLETMEPLGARPKPAMFRKLLGASSPFHGGAGASGARDGSSGQDGSASTAGPRKNGGKRIVLKRKNGGAAGDNSSNGRFDLSGTQSPTPSTAVATPQPSSTPAPEAAPEPGAEPELEPPEAAAAHARADADSDTEPEPEPKPDLELEPALPLLENRNNSPAPTASAPAAKHQAAASIPPTSDIMQPESEDHPTSEMTPTPLLHSESVLRSSPTPRRRVSQSSPSPSHHSQSMPPSLPPLTQPALATRSALFPPTYSSNPFLPDPVKQSIEDLPSFSSSHQPASPRSVASFNDIDDTFFKRESSAQSTSFLEMAPKTRAQSAAPQQTTSPAAQPSASQSPAQTQQRDGPHYTVAEIQRIVAEKDVVAKVFDAAVDEALELSRYDVAYAYRVLFEEYQDNARFLLLAESIFRQTASRESVFQFALYVEPKLAEGNKDDTALNYFEADAPENKEDEPHPPQPGPYRDLITLDLSRLQELADSKKRKRDDDNGAGETTDQNGLQHRQELQSREHAEAEPDTAEAEPEAVATPPHPSKRQKLQTREPSTGRSAGRKAASASASRGMNGRANASPSRRKTRSGSVASDSSLSTAKSLSPPLSPPQEADEDQPMQDIGHVPAAAAAAAASAAAAAVAADKTGGPNANGAEPGPGPELQPIAARPRRAPARGRRNANASSDQPSGNNAGQQNAPSTNPVGDAPGPGPQRSRNPRRGAPDFTPTQKLSEDDLATTRRRAARENTHRLTNDARSKDDSHARAEPMPGSLVRELSAQSDLSSVPDVEEPQPSPPPATGRGARATRAAKRQHEDGEGDDAASTSPDFAPNAEPSTAVTSRAATPVRPAKRARTGPRLKVS